MLCAAGALLRPGGDFRGRGDRRHRNPDRPLHRARPITGEILPPVPLFHFLHDFGWKNRSSDVNCKPRFKLGFLVNQELVESFACTYLFLAFRRWLKFGLLIRAIFKFGTRKGFTIF